MQLLRRASGEKVVIWLGMRDDYRTLIGLDSLGVVERDDDDEDVESSDV